VTSTLAFLLFGASLVAGLASCVLLVRVILIALRDL
jgi:hypothetical protein